MDLQSQLDEANREIERLRALVREQDRQRGTTTLHICCERLYDGREHIVITCPTLDENRVGAHAAAAMSYMAMRSMIYMVRQCAADEAQCDDMLAAWQRYLGGA